MFLLQIESPALSILQSERLSDANNITQCVEHRLIARRRETIPNVIECQSCVVATDENDFV